MSQGSSFLQGHLARVLGAEGGQPKTARCRTHSFLLSETQELFFHPALSVTSEQLSAYASGTLCLQAFPPNHFRHHPALWQMRKCHISRGGNCHAVQSSACTSIFSKLLAMAKILSLREIGNLGKYMIALTSCTYLSITLSVIHRPRRLT